MSTTGYQTQATVLSMRAKGWERPAARTNPMWRVRHRSRDGVAHCDLRGMIVMVRAIRYTDSRCSDRVAGRT